MNRTQYDAIIVGGGHNGLVTAGYLAKDGLSVLVLERQDEIGGATKTEELYPGFFVPYCAYICFLLQGKVVDDLRLRDYGLEIIPTAFGRLHPFPDGKHLQLGDEEDLQANMAEITRFSEDDARAYPEWISFWERAAGILHRYWLDEPPTLAQVFEDVRGTADEDVCETMFTTSLRDLLDRYFKSEYVKALFVTPVSETDPSSPNSTITTAYGRCSSFSRPEDIGIPRGGVGQIAQAMARSATDRGVEIRTDALVEKIIVEDGVSKGVRLPDGEEIRSGIVVSNADPKNTYLRLVGPENLEDAFVRRVTNLTTRWTCVKFLAALRELPDFSAYLGKDFDPRRVAEISICPSVEYCQESWDAAKNGLLSRFPVMSVQIPSIYDSSLAPPGHHVLSSWALYYPSDLKEESWERVGNKAGEIIIDTLTEYAPNFRDSIIDWTAQTPADIETREAMTDGNINHIGITSRQIFSGRMPYRSPVKGLYLCGAGTHPGGGINGAPGHNAAKAILKDLAKAGVHQRTG